MRGNLEALGRWGTASPGHALKTSGATYPTWSSPAPVSLPLGSYFSWKLVKGYPGGAVTWEAGENRQGLAAPAALVSAAARQVEGTWR